MSYSHHKGFTLVEVLVALVIFSIGLLGLGLQLSKNLNVTINKEVHSSVMQLVLQAVEPLNRAILQTPQTFQQTLNELSVSGATPVFETNNSQQNDFTITVALAEDSNGNSLFSSNAASLQPPFTVVLNVEYVAPKQTQHLNFQSTHVFVPPEETL